MTKYKLLKSKLGETKRLTRLVAIRKPCQLRFGELLVYSTLLFRVDQSGCSARRLSVMTKQHASKTTPKVLARLRELGLAVQTEDGRWHGVYPPESISGWFSLQEADQLRNQFRYNWIAIPAPDSPLTSIQAAIITQILLKQSTANIARWLRVSEKSVGRVRKMLLANGGVFKKAWFADTGKVEKRTKANKGQGRPLEVVLGIDPTLTGALRRAVAVMTEAGIADCKIRHFWGQVVEQVGSSDKLEILLFGFPDKFGKIKADHAFNKSQRKTDLPNCFNLVCYTYQVSPR